MIFYVLRSSLIKEKKKKLSEGELLVIISGWKLALWRLDVSQQASRPVDRYLPGNE